MISKQWALFSAVWARPGPAWPSQDCSACSCLIQPASIRACLYCQAGERRSARTAGPDCRPHAQPGPGGWRTRSWEESWRPVGVKPPEDALAPGWTCRLHRHVVEREGAEAQQQSRKVHTPLLALDHLPLHGKGEKRRGEGERSRARSRAQCTLWSGEENPPAPQGLCPTKIGSARPRARARPGGGGGRGARSRGTNCMLSACNPHAAVA